MELEIYSKEIVVKMRSGKEKNITITPLTGKHYNKFLALSKSMEGNKESMNVDDMITFQELVIATLVNSFPDMDIKVIEQFATQNWLQFLEAIIEVNSPSALEVPKV